MANEILITPSELSSQSTTIKDQATTASEQFATMRTQLETLGTAFKGDAAVAFEERWVEWNEHATGLIDALESLGAFLDLAASGGEALDQELSRNLRA